MCTHLLTLLAFAPCLLLILILPSITISVLACATVFLLVLHLPSPHLYILQIILLVVATSRLYQLILAVLLWCEGDGRSIYWTAVRSFPALGVRGHPQVKWQIPPHSRIKALRNGGNFTFRRRLSHLCIIQFIFQLQRKNNGCQNKPRQAWSITSHKKTHLSKHAYKLLCNSPLQKPVAAVNSPGKQHAQFCVSYETAGWSSSSLALVSDEKGGNKEMKNTLIPPATNTLRFFLFGNLLAEHRSDSEAFFYHLPPQFNSIQTNSNLINPMSAKGNRKKVSFSQGLDFKWSLIRCSKSTFLDFAFNLMAKPETRVKKKRRIS